MEVRIQAPARLMLLKAFIKSGSGRHQQHLCVVKRGYSQGKQIILFLLLGVPILSLVSAGEP